MKLFYYALAILLTLPPSTLHSYNRAQQEMTVYFTNNGEIPLLVNKILIPANPMEKDQHPIKIFNKSVVIANAHDESQFVTVPLFENDVNTVIKIGSNGSTVDILRSDKIAKRFAFKFNHQFPKKL